MQLQYVYSANDGMVANNVSGGTIYLRAGDVWWADDPFVLARPDLFSATPTLIHSTVGRLAPQHKPISAQVDQIETSSGGDVTYTPGLTSVTTAVPQPYRRRERGGRGY